MVTWRTGGEGGTYERANTSGELVVAAAHWRQGGGERSFFPEQGRQDRMAAA